MAQNGTPTGTGFGGPKVVYFNQDEQLLSTKLNNAQLFIGAELTDIVARFCASDQTGFYGGTNPNGVLSGFETSVTSFTASIAAGLGFCSIPGNPSGDPADASQAYQWVKSSVVQTIALTPNASASNYQWALIYATANEAAGDPENVAVWVQSLNAGAGGVQVQSLNQRQDPGATLGVAYGTAAGSPAVPSLPVGSVALACVLLPPSNGAPTGGAIYDVRTVLSPGMFGATGIVSGLQLKYSGGTITVTSGRAYVNGFLLQQDKAWGSGLTLSNLLGGASPSSNTVYYLYAVPTSQGQIPTVSQSDQSYSNNRPIKRPGSGFLLKASTVAPNHQGLPTANLTVLPAYGLTTSAGFGVPTNAAGFPNALFLGSVCTNSGGLVPFKRVGSHVYLEPLQAAAAVVPFGTFNVGSGYGALTFTGAAGTYPQAQATAAFGSGGALPLALPASATAMIADLAVNWAATTGAGVNFEMIDPNPGTSLSGGAYSSTGTLLTLGTTSTNIAATGRFEAVLDTNGKAWVVVPFNSTAATLNALVVYRGYVEPLTQLSF